MRPSVANLVPRSFSQWNDSSLNDRASNYSTWRCKKFEFEKLRGSILEAERLRNIMAKLYSLSHRSFRTQPWNLYKRRIEQKEGSTNSRFLGRWRIDRQASFGRNRNRAQRRANRLIELARFRKLRHFRSRRFSPMGKFTGGWGFVLAIMRDGSEEWARKGG